VELEVARLLRERVQVSSVLEDGLHDEAVDLSNARLTVELDRQAKLRYQARQSI
jgi:hypothetical protein